MRIIVALIGGMLVLPEGKALGQSAADTSGVELVAARHAVTRHGSGPMRVGLEPRIAWSGSAPATLTSVTRSPRRQQALAQGLSASSTPRTQAVQCERRVCRMAGIDLLLTISEPVFSHDSATMSVTAESVRSGRMAYETIEVALTRDGATWKVSGVTQLGIS